MGTKNYGMDGKQTRVAKVAGWYASLVNDTQGESQLVTQKALQKVRRGMYKQVGTVTEKCVCT